MTEDFPPAVALRRLQMFTKYFAANFKFGHQFKVDLSHAASLEEIQRRAEDFSLAPRLRWPSQPSRDYDDMMLQCGMESRVYPVGHTQTRLKSVSQPLRNAAVPPVQVGVQTTVDEREIFQGPAGRDGQPGQPARRGWRLPRRPTRPARWTGACARISSATAWRPSSWRCSRCWSSSQRRRGRRWRTTWRRWKPSGASNRTRRCCTEVLRQAG